MKKIIYIIVGIIVVGALVYYFGGLSGEKSETTPDGTTPEENEVIEVSTEEIIAAFDQNKSEAEKTYEGKFIKFTAFVEYIGTQELMGSSSLLLKPTTEENYLGTSIQCEFNNDSQISGIEIGQDVTLSGEVEKENLGIIFVKDCQIVQ